MIEYIKERVSNAPLVRYYGTVKNIVGLKMEVKGPPVRIGELCYVETRDHLKIPCEVTGFAEGNNLMMPLGELHGISIGDKVFATEHELKITLSEDLKGKILNGLGESIEPCRIKGDEYRGVNGAVTSPLKREKIEEQLMVGVKAVDALIPLGKGQRMGVFAGSGVGKSTLLGMMARNTRADINVIALVGERGREVREFIENDLGEEGLSRSVVVVATSDQPALVKIKAAMTATTIAEYFRDQGKDVLLMMDSVTRLAMAQREVGVSIGEKVAQKGYTPSVFSLMSKILERAGTGERGSITGLYTVLVDGDDMNDPIADSVRGILDGHIVLSRQLAHLGHYPAISVLESISRLERAILKKEAQENVREFKKVFSVYNSVKDLISIGSYTEGINEETDRAVRLYDRCNEFLRQGVEESYTPEESLDLLKQCLCEGDD